LLDLRDGEPWPAYVARMRQCRPGDDVPSGWMPSTFVVAVVAGRLVGRASIRHVLNDELLAYHGHIGYAVRPAFRRRGYATAILRRSLDVARQVDVPRALLTCDDDNIGSATVIERCGGVLENVVDGPDGAPPRRRYWIDLADDPARSSLEDRPGAPR
jgi:predicted acetyltransferase